MFNDISSQPFWNNLTDDFKSLTNKLIKSYRLAHFVNIVEIITYISILIASIFFYTKLHVSSYFVKILVLGILILILEKTFKPYKSATEKSRQKLQKQFLIEICDCTSRCTCKKDFVDYMKHNGISLLD